MDFRTADDAGVYRWPGASGLVQTVDFFTPIVDDPYQFGQIAAANAVSDVYAMGGIPLTALAVAGFPTRGLDRAVLERIFRGGYDKLSDAGVVLLGGHTVQDEEVKFGYAVTGSIDTEHIFTNAGARPGDVLLLTKPIGTGIVATAIKHRRAPAAVEANAVRWMTTLNRVAAAGLRAAPSGTVGACTDVTGFGLLGHASEVAEASGVTVRLVASAVPLLEGVLELVARHRTGGGESNEAHFGRFVRLEPGLDPMRQALLYDPQTSGGLLCSVTQAAAATVCRDLTAAGVEAATIGTVEARGEAPVIVVR